MTLYTRLLDRREAAEAGRMSETAEEGKQCRENFCGFRI